MGKLLRYMKRYTKECIISPLFKMLEACFELFVPLVVANIIDVGIANGDKGYVIKIQSIKYFLYPSPYGHHKTSSASSCSVIVRQRA